MKLNLRLENILKEYEIDHKGKYSSFISKVNNEFNQHDEAEINLERLKVVLDTTPCTVSWISKDLEYIGANKALADISKINFEDFKGRKIGSFSEDNYFEDFAKSLFQLNEKTLYDKLSTTLKGEEKVFWVVGTKFDQEEKAVIIGIDITEMEKLESTITFMDKLSTMGEMVASIIHEINNPLGLIKVQAMQITKLIEKGRYEEISEVATAIDKTTIRISKLIKGVKSFVRRGDNDPYVQASLGEIIDDAYTICEGRFKEKDISFEFDKESCNINLKCNINHLFQVFLNLMTNSIDAIESMSGKKWVRIKVKSNNGHIQLSFIDSGDGIHKKIAHQVFENFFTTKAVGKGTGIGLALCKKIMKSHEGTISIDNEAPNTTFLLEFKS